MDFNGTGGQPPALPHITIAKLRKGAVLPTGFPEILPRTIDLTRFIAGERGPHGTIRHILYQSQLWDPAEAVATDLSAG